MRAKDKDRVLWNKLRSVAVKIDNQSIRISEAVRRLYVIVKTEVRKGRATALNDMREGIWRKSARDTAKRKARERRRG